MHDPLRMEYYLSRIHQLSTFRIARDIGRLLLVEVILLALPPTSPIASSANQP